MTASPLERMFRAVPKRYDLVNRCVTLGLDRRWRALAADEILAGAPARVMDLCTGTGDLAAILARRANRDTSILAVDFCAPMLACAARKTGGAVPLALADAAALPFADRSFDAVGIGFGFRNLLWRNPHAQEHLAEIRRVLRPGGRLVVVESSQPSTAPVRLGFHFFLRAFVGPAGGLLSGQRGAYAYLARSARDFHDPQALDSLLADAGFEGVRHASLLAGAAAIHVATRQDFTCAAAPRARPRR
jgi:demethylmenaquinone methyltransferase / 2-methoxy-6-polyprenyl-1,4-benzoquinol methylase